ncbi:MAG: site-specific DNA-methyltransferase [bacterium]|nr:site-specific DNA-methyltransferase [bacterium]
MQGRRTTHRIYLGDARAMHDVADESVHLVVTSPPYWQLKDYGCEGQIGFHQSYEEYINHLSLVWQECARVLHPGCRLCINVGDQFARAAHYGRYKVLPIRAPIILACEALGFDYLGAIIWQKPTTVHTTGGAVIMGSFPYPRNGVVKLDYEFILLFRKLGSGPKVGRAARARAKLTRAEWNAYFYGHWRFPGVRQKEHLAMFPAELPRRLIKMFTFEGETVLDPFAGSGTTSIVASLLGRNSIGYEINPRYVEVMQKRFQAEGQGDAEVQFLTARATEVEYAAAVARLPFIYRDPQPIMAREGARRRRYGSRISHDD